MSGNADHTQHRRHPSVAADRTGADRISATRKRLRRNAATVFELSIAEHAQRAFGGTYNLFVTLRKRSFL